MPKIHCTECHGRGKINSIEFGEIACLKCSGTGILEISAEEYSKVEAAKIKKKQELENSRLMKEIEEKEKKIKNESVNSVQEPQSKSSPGLSSISVVLLIFVLAFIFIVVVLNWDKFVEFIKAIVFVIIAVSLFFALAQTNK